MSYDQFNYMDDVTFLAQFRHLIPDDLLPRITAWGKRLSVEETEARIECARYDYVHVSEYDDLEDENSRLKKLISEYGFIIEQLKERITELEGAQK